MTIIVLLVNGTDSREIDRITLNTTNNTLGKFPSADVDRYVMEQPREVDPREALGDRGHGTAHVGFDVGQ